MDLNVKSVMNLKKLYAILLFAIIGLTPAAMAQDVPQENTLQEQFRSIKDRSNNYQEYKVVKENLLDQFYDNVRDSINIAKQRILEAQNTITTQQQEINRLNDEVAERQEAVEQSEYAIAHTQLLGIDIEKETYNFVVWGIILALLIVLAVAFLKYKSSNKIAVKKRSEYEALDEEFNEYKVRSREKETRLMRDLQTERNAVEELNQRLVAAQKSK
jgi:hypothetical protein